MKRICFRTDFTLDGKLGYDYEKYIHINNLMFNNYWSNLSYIFSKHSETLISRVMDKFINEILYKRNKIQK